MLSRNHPDRIQITFDDRRLVANGAAPSGHPGPASRPARTRPAAPRPGRCPGAGDVMTIGGLRAGWGRLRRMCCHRGDHPGRHEGAIHPGHLELPVGPRPSTRLSRDLMARAWQAGAGPGDSPLTIAWTHLRDSDSHATTAIPASGAITRCWPHRRRADVPAARGPRQHRSGRRPLPA